MTSCECPVNLASVCLRQVVPGARLPLSLHFLCVGQDPWACSFVGVCIGPLNSRYLCPLHMSDWTYICVSVNFVCLCVPPRLCLACLYECVPTPCTDPYVVFVYVHVCWGIMCPGVPTTVHLAGGEVCVFYVYVCVSAYLVCAPLSVRVSMAIPVHPCVCVSISCVCP